MQLLILKLSFLAIISGTNTICPYNPKSLQRNFENYKIQICLGNFLWSFLSQVYNVFKNLKHFSPSPGNIERCQVINLKQEVFLVSGQFRLAFTSSKNSSTNDLSIEGEVKNNMFIVHHITFFYLLDHITRIIREEFCYCSA